MTQISLSVTDQNDQSYPIFGYCAPGFERVVEAFSENFKLGEEVGSACAVYVGNEKVVDLWGGYEDAQKSRTWREGAIVCMHSVAKAFSATALHMLAERGTVDYDTPVAEYWPEFAAGGKQDIPLRYIMDHRAGLPIIEASVDDITIYDFERFTGELASMKPLWEPGTKAGYHVLTMGYLIGAVVKRVAGKSIGTFIQVEICEPLGLDYWIGLPDDEFERCVDYVPTIKGTLFDRDMIDPNTLSAKAWAQMPLDEDFNSRAYRKAEIPGANGHGSARAVAKFYAALTGSIEDVTLLSADALDKAISKQWSMLECVLNREYNMSLGYLLNSSPYVPMGPNPRAFGHHGVGGSIGFGDPDASIGFCYAPNKMHARLDNGPRAGRLKEALFKCL